MQVFVKVSKYPFSLLFSKQSTVKSIDRRQWFWIAVSRWKTSKIRNCVRSLLRMGGAWKVFKLKDSRARQDLRSYCRWALLFYFQHISFVKSPRTVTKLNGARASNIFKYLMGESNFYFQNYYPAWAGFEKYLNCKIRE